MFYNCKKFNYPYIMWYNTHKSCACFDDFNYPTTIIWYCVPFSVIPKHKLLINILDDLVNNPYATPQRHNIINNIINTSLINSIISYHSEIKITKYKNIFKGYKMPYKVVSYKILLILEYLGIKINDAVDYNRFDNQLLADLHLNKKNTVVTNLIKHIKKTNKERYDSLEGDLISIFNKRLNKEINLAIYNNGIIMT